MVTGAAGFIGSHLTERLLAHDWHVTGVDNFDAGYDPALKRANIRDWPADRFQLIEADIRDLPAVQEHLAGDYDAIVHLAAKGGVRPSIKDPGPYEDVNVRGTRNMLELARERGIGQFIFASSGSVYGINPDVPWREDATVLRPISPYACSKASGELLGHAYSHLYGFRFLAFRFFNVYGPRQRPDSAVHKFARLIHGGAPVSVFGDGTSRRDYVYVGDIAAAVHGALSYRETSYDVFNLGSGRDASVMELIRLLERAIGTPASIERHPEQAGEVQRTCGNMAKARKLLHYQPQTALQDGVQRVVDWIRG